MNNIDEDDDQQTRYGSKRSKAKRKIKKSDHIPYDDEPNQIMNNSEWPDGNDRIETRKKKGKRQNHYSNEAFENDEHENGQLEDQDKTIKKERKKKTKMKFKETEEVSYVDNDNKTVQDEPVFKSKHKKGKAREFYPNETEDYLDEPVKEERRKPKKKILKDIEQNDNQYYHSHESKQEAQYNSDNESKVVKKKKPKRKVVKQQDTIDREDNRDYYGSDVKDNDFVDQLNDTGYESFNKKDRKKKLNKRKESRSEDMYKPDTDGSREAVLNTDNTSYVEKCDLDYEEKVYRKKKAKKKQEKRDLEKNNNYSPVNSPSVHAKIIKVHGKKTRKKEFGIEKVVDKADELDDIDDLLQEFEIDGRNNRSKIEKEKRSTDNDFDEVDLELEEMLLPKETTSSHKTNASDISLLNESKRKSTRPKKSRNCNNEFDREIDMTEVVPFNDNSDSEAELKPKHSTAVSKTSSLKKAPATESVSTSVHATTKPLKTVYAFGDDSQSEEISSSESDEEIEVPVQIQRSINSPNKYSDKPPKGSRKLGTSMPRPPILVESTNFENDRFSTDSPNHSEKSKPPRPTRKSLMEMPRSRSPSGSQVSSGGHLSELKGIFSIDGHSYDVQQKDDCITWCSVTGSNKVPRSRKKSFVRGMNSTGGSFRGSVASLGTAEIEELNTLYYQDILGVTIKKEKKSSAKHAEGVCVGFLVYTFDKKEENRLKDRPILFQHPSELECNKWIDAIKEKLEEYIERPKNIKVYVQPMAGITKYGRLTYNTKVKPLFDVADIKEDIVVVNHNEHIKQEMAHIDLNEFDCVVIVGGDGTVNKVIAAVLSKTQDLAGVEKRLHFKPTKSMCTFGIIPTGTTNHIAHSVQGVEDPVTSAIHIILGNTQTTDVCSVYEDDNFTNWCFNAHYGYFGNVLQYLNRYTMFADKKVNAAFMKGLTKSKFRSYECEVKYIPAGYEKHNHPRNGVVCYQGCRDCNIEYDNDSQDNSIYNDEVQKLDQLNNSSDEESFELQDQTPWKTVKGQFHNVSIFSIPGNMEMCPRGMSMFTHLANGTIDLALVENIEKKEFIRYLKRHGKSKDQFDFPFIHTYRCKEIALHVQFKETWEHKDHDNSDIEYETQKAEEVENEKEKRSDAIQVMDYLDDMDDVVGMVEKDSDEDNFIKSKQKPRKAFFNDSDNEETESESEDDKKKKKKKGKTEKDKKKENKKDKKKDSKDKKEEEEKEKSEVTEKKKRRPSFWSKIGKKKKEENDANKDYKNDIDDGIVDNIKDFNDSSEENDEKDDDDSDNYASNSKQLGKKQNDKEKTPEKKKKSIWHVTPGPSEKQQAKDIDHLATHKEYVEKQKRKKEEKARLKAEKRMRSFWNIDNDLQPSTSLRFRVHRGLVMIHGSGISPNTDPDEVAMKCFF